VGNSVPKNIKSRAGVLIQNFPADVSTDYGKNKLFINSLGLPFAKTTKNRIAGYIVRKLKLKEKS
jgi:ribosomal protein S17E